MCVTWPGNAYFVLPWYKQKARHGMQQVERCGLQFRPFAMSFHCSHTLSCTALHSVLICSRHNSSHEQGSGAANYNLKCAYICFHIFLFRSTCTLSSQDCSCKSLSQVSHECDHSNAYVQLVYLFLRTKREVCSSPACRKICDRNGLQEDSLINKA